MIMIVLAELAIAALAGLGFSVAYWSSPWRKSAAGRHMMAVSLVMAAESTTLFAVGVGVRIPIWTFAAGYAAMDAVVVHRLVLLWRARRLVGREYD